MGEALSKRDSASEVGARRPGTSWYAIQTLHRHEQRACRDLASKGFPTYLPLLKETHQWTDRKKVIAVPAFEGYIFVRHDASLRTRVQLLETSSVIRMLGDNHTPIPVEDAEIESLERTLASNTPCARCQQEAIGRHPIGSVVRVKSGVLAGVRGRLTRINGNLRLVLAVATVSQAISVEVDLADVEPAQDLPAFKSMRASLG